ncbi:MAG: succinate--CoA ligase subunit alpha [Candidatus Omnitrophota bacterium]|nr:succinate--CoA ligase subunit alpha [Candidatus Omnitrophota bacterium]
MSILVDEKTKVIVQGITGREGSFHTERMIGYGTKVAAGVTPGKGGQKIFGLPVFDKVKDAVSATGAAASVIFVPPSFAYEAIIEAAASGVKLIVCITEGIPVQDMLKAIAFVREKKVKLIGPNCPGIVSTGKAKLGIIPNSILKGGPVGVVSRSGTLTYEIINNLSTAGIGQSSCVGIGGDPILGTRFLDILPLFEQDKETSLVVMVGEIGGSDEEEAARFIVRMKKPVIGFISGKTAPPEKRMGHAGAIISGGFGTVESKEKALKEAHVFLADHIYEITSLVRSLLK